jgi:hypothetical protein
MLIASLGVVAPVLAIPDVAAGAAPVMRPLVTTAGLRGNAIGGVRTDFVDVPTATIVPASLNADGVLPIRAPTLATS